jgi:hypothetical protein
MSPAACKLASATATEYPMRSLPSLPPVHRGTWRAADRFAGGLEPSISELLEDPILERLLARDGLSMEDLLCVIAAARTMLKRR